MNQSRGTNSRAGGNSRIGTPGGGGTKAGPKSSEGNKRYVNSRTMTAGAQSAASRTSNPSGEK